MKAPEQIAEGLIVVEDPRTGRGHFQFGKSRWMLPAAAEGGTACRELVAAARVAVADAVRSARAEMYAHALGEAPACEAVKAVGEGATSEEVVAAIAELGAYIDHLHARVAHMARDSGFDDGYQAGLAEGKRRCVEAVGVLFDTLTLAGYGDVARALEKVEVAP